MISERRIVLLVGAVQFVNILDFMIVMPLGPDFSEALGIPTARLGLVGGAYTGAAAISGLLGALVLDRFDRRSALAVALAGLIVGTLAGGFATGLGTMLAARVLAGAFGGPATSLSLAILTDVVPVERRGKALGAVMSAFSLASVLGVPAALELARVGGWRLPFFAVAGMGVLLAGAAIFALPPLRLHLARPDTFLPMRSLGAFLRDRVVLCALAATATATMGGFSLIPNLSTYFQFNLGYPRERLGLLYLVGGAISFVTVRACGVLVDRYGALLAILLGSAILVADIAGGFVWAIPGIPVMVLFVGFMFGNSFRNVAVGALGTRVPLPAERARFMSAQSAVQHLAASVGAVAAASMLTERPDHGLDGIARVGLLSLAMTLAMPLFAWGAVRALRARPAAHAA